MTNSTIDKTKIKISLDTFLTWNHFEAIKQKLGKL